MAPVLLVLLLLFFSLPAYSSNLKLISSDNNSLAYEFRAEGIEVRSKNMNSVLFQEVSIKNSGLTKIIGAPLLPVKSKLITVPYNKKLSFRVTETKSRVYSDFNILPCPEIIPQEIYRSISMTKKFSINDKIYSENRFYPEQIAEISKTGFIRGRKVALLKIFPVQYNPVSKKLKFYSFIRVNISFEPDKEKTVSRKIFNQKLSALSSSMFSPLKISIKEDGIYRITTSDLEQAGIDTSALDPRTFKMLNNEDEIAVLSYGEDDGKFNEGDYIEFYGERNRDGEEFTDTNIYWLVADETQGKRMNLSGKFPSLSSVFETSFKATYHGEENHDHYQAVPKEEGKDHWFWHTFILGENESKLFAINFTLNNLKKKKGNTSLKIHFQGLSNVSANPDHHTQIFLNDKWVGEAKWDGITEHLLTIAIPHSLLKNSLNTLEIKSTAEKGVTIDGIAINGFDLEYYKQFVAENDSLTFLKSGNKKSQFRITNFSKKSVKVFDVSAPYEVKLIKAKIKKIGGKFAVLFKDEIKGGKKYIAITDNSIKKPDSIEIDEESNLKSSENSADYIIITHKDFYDSILPLKNFREAQGYVVEIVKIDDVYDEFSSGNFTPDAIRDFLKFAYENWNPKPLYVLLVGDASYDYKDYKKTGVKNYIPVKLVHTGFFGPTPSDTWFACVDGDDKYPDIYIGRVPVKTKEEADAVIDKIISYENSQPFADWNKNILLISDNYLEKGVPDDGGNFPILSDNLATLLSDPFVAQKVYLQDYPEGTTDAQLETIVSTTKTKIIEKIDSGALVTNYTGHGALDDWSREKIFTASDISSLNNNSMLTFIITLNCLNGFFPDYEKESLGEEFLLNGNNGAVAFWGPTGLGFNNDYEKIGNELFKTLFQKKEKTAGKAVTESLITAVTDNYLSDDYLEDLVLLGDPALQIGLPE